MQNFYKISDLERLVSKDEIYKFGRTYHFNAIAMNKTGLKNLFILVSLANTKYLYKTPRILRSEIEKYREFNNDKEKHKFETSVCSVFGGKRCAHHRAVAILYDKGVRV